MKAVIIAQEKHQDALFTIPGITSVGVGKLKNQDNIYSEEQGIIVFYDVPDGQPAPTIPDMLDGFKTELRRSRFTFPGQRDNQHEYLSPPADAIPKKSSGIDNPRDVLFNPMIGGISGNPDFFYVSSWTGTIGLVVKDNKTHNPLIMSNQHVICGKNPKVGDGVSQPARNWFGDEGAKLTKWIHGNVISNGVSYGMDAAIAAPSNKRRATPGEIYGIDPVTQSAEPAVGDNVLKSGLTTDITRGEIEVVNVTVKIDDVRLDRQFFILATNCPAFSEGGDSGSAVIRENTGSARAVVGLLWGGDTADPTRSVASPINPILSYFDCSVS